MHLVHMSEQGIAPMAIEGILEIHLEQHAPLSVMRESESAVDSYLTATAGCESQLARAKRSGIGPLTNAPTQAYAVCSRWLLVSSRQMPGAEDDDTRLYRNPAMISQIEQQESAYLAANRQHIENVPYGQVIESSPLEVSARLIMLANDRTRGC